MTAAARAALARASELLDRPPADPDVSRGYLDLLGPAAPESTGPGEALMRTALLPAIYERWWRPVLGQVAKGITGPTMSHEHRMARELLELGPGALVLDVACGPGNFTRDFGGAVGAQGLAVGIDASTTMLARAVSDTAIANVAYVRGDAVELPFATGVFDAVCCFAALHMFSEPFRALDHMARVLKPGGRLALMTSARRGLEPIRSASAWAITAGSGMRMFDREEVCDALRTRGFGDLSQRVNGLAQFVGARRLSA
jgi:SAM-dependent methyltransferase